MIILVSLIYCSKNILGLTLLITIPHRLKFSVASENEKLKERNRTLEMELSEIRSQLDHDRQRTNDIDEANAALIKTFTEREEELCLKLDKMAGRSYQFPI